jgi:hypothetical protein
MRIKLAAARLQPQRTGRNAAAILPAGISRRVLRRTGISADDECHQQNEVPAQLQQTADQLNALFPLTRRSPTSRSLPALST